MKTLMIVLYMCAAMLASPATAEAPRWIVGCWESPDESATEVWVIEPDGTLIGFGVALDQGKVRFYEVLKIESNENGVLFYTAHPIGQAAASFRASKETSSSVVFTNPAHDYPQEISYRREGNMLYASTSALGGRDVQSFTKRTCQ